MIGIIKYQAGNLASVANALERLGAKYFISDDADELEKANGIIFPGVGHAGAAMDDLRSRDLDIWLKNTKKPVLGICLGMQLLYDSSEEGDSHTLGLIPGRLKNLIHRRLRYLTWAGTSLMYRKNTLLFPALTTKNSSTMCMDITRRLINTRWHHAITLTISRRL